MYCIKLQRVGSALTMSPGIPIFSISGIQQNQLKVALLALFLSLLAVFPQHSSLVGVYLLSLTSLRAILTVKNDWPTSYSLNVLFAWFGQIFTSQ